MSPSALLHDLAWDSPLTRRLAEDATAAAYTHGTVVDLGCGTGLLDREFIARGQVVTGVDGDDRMLRRAVRRGRITTAVCADSAATGLPNASADAVLVSNVMHSHPDPRAVLAEACRIARPGARVVLLWPTEAATTDQLRSLDTRRATRKPSAVLADLIRRFGMVATRETRSPSHPSSELEAIVFEAVASAGLHLVSSSTIFGCEQVTILRMPGGADAAEAATTAEIALLFHDSATPAPAPTEDHEREHERTVSPRTRR